MAITIEDRAAGMPGKTAASAGIHHVTAITRDVKRNVRFYTEVLGLRLVKRTVNFDDPGAYHLYFGDATGRPGTILTFFAWEGANPGRLGLGQAAEIAFRIPRASLGWWTQRLIEQGIAFDGPEKRFGENVLGFKDPDGIRLELVAAGTAAPAGDWSGTVPAEHAVEGFHGVTLWLSESEGTAAVLREVFGMREVAAEGTRRRFAALGADPGAVVDLREAPGFIGGRMGTGTVHHVAFRAADDAAQAAMAAALQAQGGRATEQKDRSYFRSVYFREPGGVIFEIATDDPGFTVDESIETLGEALKLPPQFEAHREAIAAALPALD
ncbi:ring-cleaving dioxygenase [Labrys wisconsinensis]|uniref:Glyoxalase family protein n=1 Tax=Labrys wisconsinensis TaxID=425677 RepID=A0ABU0JJE9_9HYPH|nr:ring-cleaving dioxygenase [Labrys wisconsinensis]MDQ0474412.1 glyoxalase family protein [Labrys wisconsinensis]